MLPAKKNVIFSDVVYNFVIERKNLIDHIVEKTYNRHRICLVIIRRCLIASSEFMAKRLSI